MPSLNDLALLWLQGDQAMSQTQLSGRPSIQTFENPALTDRALAKAGNTRLLSYNVFNPNTSVAILQLFNAASVGVVTLGTTTPVKQLSIPAGAVLDGTWDFGPAFPLGMVIAATTLQKGTVLVTTGLVVSLGVL